MSCYMGHAFLLCVNESKSGFAGLRLYVRFSLKRGSLFQSAVLTSTQLCVRSCSCLVLPCAFKFLGERRKGSGITLWL